MVQDCAFELRPARLLPLAGFLWGYCLEPFEQTQGNCNSSSSTLLYKAGVPLSRIKDLRKQISGLVWGFGDIKPWTVEEQSKAVQRQRELDQLRNEMMNTIILNKY